MTTVGGGPRGRGRRLIRPLRLATTTAAVAAAAAVVLPGRPSVMAGTLVLAVVIAGPLGRVAFLAGRWWQLDDRPYAGRAAGLLVVVTAGAVIALLT